MTSSLVNWSRDGSPDFAPFPVSNDPAPEFVPGQHVFTISAVFTVVDPSRTQQMADRENLRAMVGPFCWWCKTASDDGTPCPGRKT